MITLKLKYSLDDIQDRNLIHSYMNQYNHVFRVAYNKFTIDNLQTKNGFLGIGKYDQTKYTGYQYGIVE